MYDPVMAGCTRCRSCRSQVLWHKKWSTSSLRSLQAARHSSRLRRYRCWPRSALRTRLRPPPPSGGLIVCSFLSSPRQCLLGSGSNWFGSSCLNVPGSLPPWMIQIHTHLFAGKVRPPPTPTHPLGEMINTASGAWADWNHVRLWHQ